MEWPTVQKHILKVLCPYSRWQVEGDAKTVQKYERYI